MSLKPKVVKNIQRSSWELGEALTFHRSRSTEFALFLHPSTKGPIFHGWDSEQRTEARGDQNQIVALISDSSRLIYKQHDASERYTAEPALYELVNTIPRFPTMC